MTNIEKYIDKLRLKISDIIESLETWATLKQVSENLGLSIYDDQGLGKRKYLQSVTERTPSSQIIFAARRILDGNYPGNRMKPSDRDVEDIQELIWWIDSQGEQKISHVTRHRILDALEGFPFWGRLSVSSFFHSVNVHSDFGSMPSVGNDGKLYRGLEWNLLSVLSGTKPENYIPPVEISNSQLFQDLGFLDWSDNKFCRVLERMLHPEVQPVKMQQRLHTIIRPLLNIDEFDLEVINSQGGYPVYGICRRNLGVSGSPKYLIFASIGKKPDIVIDDAVNMNIRIVTNADQCLVYDQPPPIGDLTWKMLLDWWSKGKGPSIPDTDLRRDLGKRLQDSLQPGPESWLFETYFKKFKPIFNDNLPALIPQVYLHYDPRNKNERDNPVLVRQRMDFLLLLRNSSRIVLEIDGKQHYADDNEFAAPLKYAEMVKEDRRIKLQGYEVYRFGGAEFIDPEKSKTMIGDFFSQLFLRHGISPS